MPTAAAAGAETDATSVAAAAVRRIRPRLPIQLTTTPSPIARTTTAAAAIMARRRPLTREPPCVDAAPPGRPARPPERSRSRNTHCGFFRLTAAGGGAAGATPRMAPNTPVAPAACDADAAFAAVGAAAASLTITARTPVK